MPNGLIQGHNSALLIPICAMGKAEGPNTLSPYLSHSELWISMTFLAPLVPSTSSSREDMLQKYLFPMTLSFQREFSGIRNAENKQL